VTKDSEGFHGSDDSNRAKNKDGSHGFDGPDRPNNPDGFGRPKNLNRSCWRSPTTQTDKASTMMSTLLTDPMTWTERWARQDKWV